MGSSHTQSRRYRTRDEWRAIIDDFNRSGLTKKQFCEQRGLRLSSFSNWWNTFKSEAQEPAFVPLAKVTPMSLNDDPTVSWDIELDLGQGVTLRIRR